MGNARWTWIAIGFQTGLAYAISLIIYQFGAIVLYGQHPNIWTALALTLMIAGLYSLLKKPSSQLPIITLKNIENGEY